MRATLLATFLEIVGPWRHVFPQQRTWRRAVRQALGSLVCLGRRCLSRIIWTNGGQGRSWSAEYFLHSRCHWQPPALFQPIWDRALPLCRGRLVGVAVDDTRLPKTGRCIVQAAYHRDPLSPPFHVNLIRAVRFLQASLLVPMHRRAPRYTRALPVRFDEVSYVKKPSRRAPAEAWAQYKAAVTMHNLSRHFVTMAHAIRQTVDGAGGARKTLVLAGDSSFCNRTCMRAVLDRTELIVRTRKDAVLCHRAAPGGRRFYAPTTFTPDELRHDAARPWHVTKVCYGGKRRTIRYKDVPAVHWRHGAARRPLRLFVVAPTPYYKRQRGRRYYRHPAYLLTTDLRSGARALLQIYFDRWQIEVNHRDEKDTLGVGHAQLWNPVAVPKQPVLAVAAYSALLLAALLTFGAERSAAYAPLPKWRRRAHRPSCLDLITLLRQEMVEHPELLTEFDLTLTDRALTSSAAA
jgi:DDE superfamily endonuclease